MKTEEKASSVVVHVVPKVGQKIYDSACWLSQQLFIVKFSAA